VGYRAVFFDAGETLLAPHPGFVELFTAILREAGHEFDPAALREALPKVNDRFNRAAREGELWSTSRERSRAWWREIYAIILEGLGIPFDETIARRLYETFTDSANYRPFPDVVGTLERLRDAGFRLGLISNFEEWLEQLLESLELSAYFEVRVISGAVGMEKPDPRIFQAALDRTGVEASESVYVGDNPFFDIEPAERLGMLAVLIDRRGRFPGHPGPRVTTLDDLPAVIGLHG